MTDPYPIDFREEAVKQYLAGEGTYDQVSASMDIGSASLKRWVAKKRAGKSLAPAKKGGRKPKLTLDAVQMIWDLVQNEPNWTTSELAREVFTCFGIEVSRHVIGRTLRALGITFKRGSSGLQLPESHTMSPGN